MAKKKARDLGVEADLDLDRTTQAVNGWINDLAEAGTLDEVGTDGRGAKRYQAAGSS